MIALDTNVLIALFVQSQKEYARTRKWLEKTQERFATTSTNVSETLRLLTHPKVFPCPLLLDQALDLLSDFLKDFDVQVLEDDPDWWKGLKGLLPAFPSLRGNEVFDARIALCLRYHGVKEICTFDADFKKYPFLKVVVPE